MSLQAFSPRNISSIIVEPRVLVRDSLNSLVTSHSYRVVGSYASAFDIRELGDTPEQDRPNLAIIGAQSIEQAIDEALCIRKLFADSKIVVLLETISADDIRRMSEPTIDACVPLYASQDVLMRMLEVVTSGSARVVVLADAPHSSQPTRSLRRNEAGGVMQKHLETADGEAESFESRGAGDDAAQGEQHTPLAPAFVASDEDHWSEHARHGGFEEAPASRPCGTGATIADAANPAKGYAWNAEAAATAPRQGWPRPIRDHVVGTSGTVADAAKPAREPKISDRELQILDGLVKGHGNKMIARECAITEATVKVHMKSILRKICVANRTQAAIWALEHGYCTHLPGGKIERPVNGSALRPQNL